MRGLLWFVSVVLLLGSTDGGSLDRMSYGDQPENIRAVIDKAIVKANEDYGSKHIDFYSVLANVSISLNICHVSFCVSLFV